MKIIIDKGTYYEMNIPESCNGDQLEELLQRLEDVYKFIRLNNHKQTIENNNEPPRKRRKYKKGANSWRNDREFVVKLLQTQYHGTKEDKKQIAKELNDGVDDWDTIAKSFWNLRKKHDIQPEEAGMKKFPIAGEQFKINELKLKSEDNKYGRK